MRGTDIQGRFSIDHEAYSIWEGIRDELASPVGVVVDWYRWDQEFLENNIDVVVDDIYDTSNPTPGAGRIWKDALKVPVVTAQIYQGQIQQNDRGFYNTDTLRVVINVEDALRIFPSMASSPDSFIKDRVVFRHEVFTPIRVNPRGHMNYLFAVITVDLVQVNPEELVNDPQFQSFSGGNDPLDITPASAPLDVVCTPIIGGITVTWDAPLSNGGSPIRSYVVATDTDGLIKTIHTIGLHGWTTTFSGLDETKEYSVRVAANTRAGSGAASPYTTAVSPLPI